MVHNAKNYDGKGNTGNGNKGTDKTADQIKNITKQESKVWKSFDNYKNGIKSTGKGSNKQYYEWDHTHNDIEVYNNKGKHLGSMDPTTGKMYKPAVKGRTIKLN